MKIKVAKWGTPKNFKKQNKTKQNTTKQNKRKEKRSKLLQEIVKRASFFSNCLKTEKKHFKRNYFQNNIIVKDALNQKANISCFPNYLIAIKNQNYKCIFVFQAYI